MTVLWNRVAGDEMLVLVTNVFVQITLLAALALMVARLFRHAAPIRHGILLSAVLAVSAIPLLTAMLQLAGLSVVAIPVKWDLGFAGVRLVFRFCGGVALTMFVCHWFCQCFRQTENATRCSNLQGAGNTCMFLFFSTYSIKEFCIASPVLSFA